MQSKLELEAAWAASELDRFHLVIDAIDRANLDDEAAQKLRQAMQVKLIEHDNYIKEHGEDMDEVRNWVWPFGKQA